MSVFKQVFWTVQLKLDNWSTAWSRDRGHETSTVGGETPCEGRRESYRRNERKQHEDGLRMCEDHHRSQHKDQSSRRATELNDFFNRFDQPLPPPPSPQPLSPSKSLLLLISTPSLPLITTDLVRRQLRKLWPRKTTGLDKVFLLLLRTCAAELGEPLQQIAIKTLFQFWRRIGPVRRAFDNNNHAHALCVCYFMIMSSVQYLVSQLVCVCVFSDLLLSDSLTAFSGNVLGISILSNGGVLWNRELMNGWIWTCGFSTTGQKRREFRRMSLCDRRELPQCAGSRDSSEMLFIAAHRSDSDIPAMDSHLLMKPS